MLKTTCLKCYEMLVQYWAMQLLSLISLIITSLISKNTWFQRANLSHLNLSGNFLDAYFKDETSEKFLDNQLFIQNISIARNKIDKIPRHLFKNTINLREIDLSKNELENVQFIGPNLKRIKLLNQRGNFIYSLSEQEMKVLDSVVSDRLTIDLSENDILCTCDTLNFLMWIEHHAMESRIVFRNLKSYKCSAAKSAKFNLSDLHDIIGTLDKQCSTYTGLIVGCGIMISVMIFTLTGGILYRYRWKLRYEGQSKISESCFISDKLLLIWVVFV